MIPSADFENSSPADDRLDKLTQIASGLGGELVDLAAAMNQIDASTKSQLQTLDQVRENAKQMLEGNASVRGAIDTVHETTVETLDAVISSAENIQNAGVRTQKLATWVQSLDERITVIEESIQSARSNNNDIASIAAQVNILAINAKIEAARAGEAGLGFAVVAEAINELSRKTAKAAEGINVSIATLGDWVESLRGEASDAATDAIGVLAGADETNVSLTGIADHVRLINSEASQIKINASNVSTTIDTFDVSFGHMGESLEQTASGIHHARQRANTLVSQSEYLIQSSVSLGGVTQDTRFISEVQSRAAQITARFEAAISSGEISRVELFSQKYKPIVGSDPQQVMTSFTGFTDKVLPEFQEPVLEFDSRVVFCAAIDKSGYIPTHNKNVSQPLSSDPVWNMAYCRNRRIFDDTVGLKAGNNTEPFLLQTYHRDMGAGAVTTMKDVSAPIIVNGVLWGGLRMGYVSD